VQCRFPQSREELMERRWLIPLSQVGQYVV
jgi:hypothetical protein